MTGMKNFIFPALAFVVLFGGRCGEEPDGGTVTTAETSELEEMFETALAALVKDSAVRHRTTWQHELVRGLAISPLPPTHDNGPLWIGRAKPREWSEGLRRKGAQRAWETVAARWRTVQGWVGHNGPSDPPPQDGSALAIEVWSAMETEDGGYMILFLANPVANWHREALDMTTNEIHLFATFDEWRAGGNPGPDRVRWWAGDMHKIRVRIEPGASGGWSARVIDVWSHIHGRIVR